MKSSVTTTVKFWSLIISPIVSSNTVRTFLSFSGLYSSILFLSSFMYFQYLIKTLENLKLFRSILLIFQFVWILDIQKDFIITVRWLIKWNNAFVFSDLEPANINILYGWPEICCQRRLCSWVFSPVTSSNLIIIYSASFFMGVSLHSSWPSTTWIWDDSVRRLYFLIIICKECNRVQSCVNECIVSFSPEPLLKF